MRATEFITEVTGLQYKGYPCTKDCGGHMAGYAWAKYWGISDATRCPYGSSNSFWEGCLSRCTKKKTAPPR